MVGGSSTRFSSEAHLRIGRWLRSKWHLDSLIAIGGMASVYAGTHRNGARAAIKVLHAQYTRNEQARRRFLAEGYAANKVGHRNAVSVLDDDITEDGEVYLVMELLEGESFEGRLDRVGVMNPMECLQIAEQMLEVLACAHARGILHRDIKPANVFLCRDGSVKLLDFGLARVRELSAEALDQSDGIVFGTVSYIAPEQARADNQNLDARSDMWSVAATMFRALTGETVFPAEGPVIERLMAVARRPARSLASVDPRLPRLVVELVDRALAFDPEDRWPSANVMRVVVQDVLAQLTEEAEEAAAAAPRDEFEFQLNTSSVFNRQPTPSQTQRPVTPMTRPPNEPNMGSGRHPSPLSAPATTRSGRPKTDPFGAMPEHEPDEAPIPDDADEVDLDVDSLQGPSAKRGRTRTLLTKEGRAELRRILDARRTQKAKGDPTPAPVHMPTPTPVAMPTPTPTPAPVHVAGLIPRVTSEPSPAAPPVQSRTRPTTEPSPVAQPEAVAQPRPRTTTEPSPVAQPEAVAQPRPRTTTEPSPTAPPPEASAIDMTLEDEGSMLASGMVVFSPEESIIELTIDHRPTAVRGTIAERLPGPNDSQTTAAYPAIGAPPARPAPRPAAVEEGRAPPPPSKGSTASYPAIGKPPAKAPAVPPQETTKVGPAPVRPPVSEPRPTAVPVSPPAAVRSEEPPVEVTKVTRVPLPTFGKPTATPTGPTPGPLPSRSSLPTASSPGESEERKPSGAGRWAPPVKFGAPAKAEPVKAEPVKAEPVKVGLPLKPEAAKAEPVKVGLPLKPEAAKVEPAKAALPAKPEATKPVQPEVARPVKASVGKPQESAPVSKVEEPKPTPAKFEAKPPIARLPDKPTAKPEPSKPVVTSKPEVAKPEVAAPEVAKVAVPVAKLPVTKPVGAGKVDAPKPIAEPARSGPVSKPEAKLEPEKPPTASKPEVKQEAKLEPEALKVEPEKPPMSDPVNRPEAKIEEAAPSEPPPDLLLPGAGLSRPAPKKSVFSVPYAGLGKPADKATKPEPAEPAKGTKKSS